MNECYGNAPESDGRGQAVPMMEVVLNGGWMDGVDELDELDGWTDG